MNLFSIKYFIFINLIFPIFQKEYYLLLAGEDTEKLVESLTVGHFQRYDTKPNLYDSKAHAYVSIAVPLKTFHQVTSNCKGK